MSHDELYRLSNEQVRQIMERGYTWFMFPTGRMIRITEDDIVFKREELQEFVEREKAK